MKKFESKEEWWEKKDGREGVRKNWKRGRIEGRKEERIN